MKKSFFWAALFTCLCIIAGNTAAQLTQTYMASNQTGMTITSIFISPNDADKWSTNLSTKDKLTNGESFEFKQPVDHNNCLYDIKFLADNGMEYIMKGMNLCSVSTIAVVMPEKTDQKLEKTDKK